MLETFKSKEVELKCHFCNKSYMFSVDELKKVKEKAKIQKK